MAATISKKLSNSFEGALAGGGDPATSPLYVFGPFLKLVVIAGVAQVTFGATIWLAVLTVIMVSAMYRQVMIWVTDGSGGSGLSEEEFGSWAVKINAGITVIEYTLTFLVSMAALVTFAADRAIEFGIPLNQPFLGIEGGYKIIMAIILSVFTGWLVNRGPKVSARAFGPATAAVLALLWVMIFATIYKFGVVLPDFNFKAFSLEAVNYVNQAGEQIQTSFLHLTLGGYARILALMTGIEIFANLVAAYEGKRHERSRKAFGSLMIIMGTTALTMIIVGPAILAVSEVSASSTAEEVSVFTQTMNALLPAWASYAGTLIGIAVLLSACAAAAQGIQNLALGLRYRHYVPADLGERNKHDVAAKPVWLIIIIIALSFIFFGTHEETYLALYAAGVFILLSMTGWAASKRLLRRVREDYSFGKLATLIGTVIAAFLTTGATLIIFEERFWEGAWSYLLLVPALYLVFSYYRKNLGAPPSVEERLGLVISEQRYFPLVLQNDNGDKASFGKILVPLDGSNLAEQVLPMARKIARSYNSHIELLTVADDKAGKETQDGMTEYLEMIADSMDRNEISANFHKRKGSTSTEIDKLAVEQNVDLIVMSTRGKFEVGQLVKTESMAQKLLKKTLTPVLLVRPTDDWRSRRSKFERVLVALDGSEAAEVVLPYIRAFASRFDSKVLLFSVPEGSESEDFNQQIQHYLDDIAETLKEEGFNIITLVAGSGPARTIVALSEEEKVDLIMMASHGRGGTGREKIHLGSVADRVVRETPCPVFLVPLTRSEK